MTYSSRHSQEGWWRLWRLLRVLWKTSTVTHMTTRGFSLGTRVTRCSLPHSSAHTPGGLHISGVWKRTLSWPLYTPGRKTCGSPQRYDYKVIFRILYVLTVMKVIRICYEQIKAMIQSCDETVLHTCLSR